MRDVTTVGLWLLVSIMCLTVGVIVMLLDSSAFKCDMSIHINAIGNKITTKFVIDLLWLMEVHHVHLDQIYHTRS